MTHKKYDNGKPRMDLLPPNALIEVARGFTYGAGKYGDHNYLEGKPSWGRYFAAAGRHMFSWLSGKDIDRGSGVHHLAMATCNLLILMEYFFTSKGEDSRPRAARAPGIEDTYPKP